MQLTDAEKNVTATKKELHNALEEVKELKLEKEDVANQFLEPNYFGPSALLNVPQGFANMIVAWIELHPEEVSKHRETLDRLKAVRKSEDRNGQGK